MKILFFLLSFLLTGVLIANEDFDSNNKNIENDSLYDQEVDEDTITPIDDAIEDSPRVELPEEEENEQVSESNVEDSEESL